MFYVYAIKSEVQKRTYIGYTSNIGNRLKYHNSGYVKSTSNGVPWRIVALEKIQDKDEARWIERSLKKSLGKRLKWIDKNRME